MIKSSFLPYTLVFRFDAGTSRGILRKKTSWFIKVWQENYPEVFGLGECGPLPGLSPEDNSKLADVIKGVLEKVAHKTDLIRFDETGRFVSLIVPKQFPAVSFALETALLDLNSGGKRRVVENDFVRGVMKIPINGLIWMGDKDFMMQQIRDKLEAGYNCLKMKVGAIDIETELEIIKYIRRKYSSSDITIRLDANGAFKLHHALENLERFSVFGIHSIEQPIQAGQLQAMYDLCRVTPIPIALDEELIGISGLQREALLDTIKPQYIIIKPTMVGGLSDSEQWINLANKKNIGWWITSALESNIGLNAIAQFTAGYQTNMYQGLGTGQLYHNNFGSPLYIKDGYLGFDPKRKWNLSGLDF